MAFRYNLYELSRIITQIALTHYPNIQAIYLFGSIISDNWLPNSDIDIAILLPPDSAKNLGNLSMTTLHYELAHHLQCDIDLINVRQVSTVFQYIIVNTGKVIHCANEGERRIFEMLVWSFYQKLNEERAAILEAFFKFGLAYAIR
jgi:predicted nucleotidyltransferase